MPPVEPSKGKGVEKQYQDYCVLCGKPATTSYPGTADDDAPSCGSFRCELTMQAASDHADEHDGS